MKLGGRDGGDELGVCEMTIGELRISYVYDIYCWRLIHRRVKNIYCTFASPKCASWLDRAIDHSNTSTTTEQYPYPGALPTHHSRRPHTRLTALGRSYVGPALTRQ
jgi:hypothetical protein